MVISNSDKSCLTLSTLDEFSNNTKAKPRDLPVVGSVFRLHSNTVPYLAK